MNKIVYVKLENKYIVIPVGNHVSHYFLELNDMAFDIMNKMMDGVEEEKIIEEYEKIFLNVPSVKIDVQCCINMINGIFTERKNNTYSKNEVFVHKNAIKEIQEYYVIHNKPYKVFLELTYNCNLRCPHCYIQKDLNKREKFRDKKEILNLIDEMEKQGVVELNITGGEATLHPDFLEIIRYATSKNMLVTLLTNGQNLYDKSYIDELKDCPLFEVRISLYGNQSYHNKFVGKSDAFEKSIWALKELRKTKGIGTGTYIVTNENYMYVDELTEMLNRYNIPIILSPIIMPTTHGDKTPTELRLSRDQLKIIMSKYATNLFGASCTAGISRFRIRPDGVVNPCEMMRTIDLGNVYNDSFKKVMDGDKRKKWVEEYKKILDKHECNSCRLRKRCNMCPGLFYVQNGDYNKKDDFLCMHAAIKEEIDIERKGGMEK